MAHSFIKEFVLQSDVSKDDYVIFHKSFEKVFIDASWTNGFAFTKDDWEALKVYIDNIFNQ